VGLFVVLAACETVIAQTAPAPVIAAVVNAASGLAGAIAPGEEISIYGANFGPASVVEAQPANGAYPTAVANTQVLFDGVPAPIIALTQGQINAMAPFEIAGRASTSIQVIYLGTSSSAMSYPVTGAAMGIYALDQSGAGQAAATNLNGAVNAPNNPANGYIQVFMTGLGVTNPPGVNGGIAPIDGSDLKFSPLTLTASIGSVPAAVEYAGSAPGFVYGVMQLNVDIPANAPRGNVPLIIYALDPQPPFTSGASQPGVTIWVQ